jgi:hypothetical protein
MPRLIFVALCEYVTEEQDDDPYVLETVEQYRELYLERQSTGEYIYYQQLWRQVENATKMTREWQRYGEPIMPVFRQTPLSYIPFCMFGPSTITPAVEKSPILDLVDANLSHFRSSADLEHGRHFCGLPTPWIAGFPADLKLAIGSSVAWVSNDPQAHAGMLEFTGQGLGALETAIKDKKEDMAVLGARILEPQKQTVEAAETLRTRLSGEFSVLQSVAMTVSGGFTKLIRWSAAWLGAGESADKAVIKLNTELVDTTMTFDELAKLVSSWQSGALSYSTLYFNMKRGGLTRPGIDAENEQAEIEIEKPVTIPQNIDPATGLPIQDLNEDGTPKGSQP